VEARITRSRELHRARVLLAWVVAALTGSVANVGMLLVTAPILEAWMAVPLLAPYWGIPSFLFAALTLVVWSAPQARVVGWLWPGQGWPWIGSALLGWTLGQVATVVASLPFGGLPALDRLPAHDWQLTLVGVLGVSLASLPQAAVLSLRGNTARIWVVVNTAVVAVQAWALPSNVRMEDFEYSTLLLWDIARGSLLGAVVAYQAGILRSASSVRPEDDVGTESESSL
jgi:hypothetical protein